MVKLVFRDVGDFFAHTHLKREPFTTAALIAGASALLGAGASAVSSNSINKKNIRNQNELWEKQKAYQNWLNANGALVQRQAQSRAGLNPNADFGTSAHLQTPSPSRADLQMPDFSAIPQGGQSVAQMIQQQPLINAQAQKTMSESKQQDIINSRLIAEDNAIKYYDILDSYYTATDEKQKEQYKNQLLEVDVVPHNKGWFESRKSWREFQTEVNELDAKDIKAKLDKIVWEGKFDNNEVVQALQLMDLEDYKRTCEGVRNLIKDRDVMDSVKALNDQKTSESKATEEMLRFQKKLAEESNIFEMIHKYLGDGAMADAAAFFVFIVSAMTGSINIGFSKKF